MARIYAVIRGCTKCGWCLHECPVQAITQDQDGAHIDADKCTGCGKCYRNCASEAIEAVETEDS
ncbi:MAG: 4Fe-4S dicluster domain-containing protein [Armatimonadia bacterium]